MHEKIKMGVTVFLYIFLNAGFCLSKLDFEKCVISIYFFSEWVKLV
jgi:hypothetical protein